MSKHSNKESDQIIKDRIAHVLKERQDFGIAQGMYAMAHLVNDLASNEEQSEKERLNTIIDHCLKVIESAKPSDHPGETV